MSKIQQLILDSFVWPRTLLYPPSCSGMAEWWNSRCAALLPLLLSSNIGRLLRWTALTTPHHRQNGGRRSTVWCPNTATLACRHRCSAFRAAASVPVGYFTADPYWQLCLLDSASVHATSEFSLVFCLFSRLILANSGFLMQVDGFRNPKKGFKSWIWSASVQGWTKI